MINNFYAHAASIVTKAYHDIATLFKSPMSRTIGFIKMHVLRFNGDFSQTGDGIPRVYAEIRQNLVNLGGIDFHRMKASRGIQAMSTSRQ